MKNLHILPTDKPSRLYKELGRELKYTTKYFEQKGLNILNNSINQNIYITSDEEVKDGYFINCDMICKFDESKVSKEWITDEFVNGYSLKTNVYYSFETEKCKKIILTTDQDLIKDGVQAIDDEFLKWFVKNPSCEEVEVKDVFKSSPIGFGNAFDYYKIIIPKEEPKPEYSKIREGLKKSIEGKEHFIHHFKNGGTVEDFKPSEEAKQRAKNYMSLKGALEPKQEKDDSYIKEQKERRRKLFNLIDELEEKKLQEEPKQETLEEFIDKVDTPADFDQFTFDEGIRVGAKWQQENSYSEEEVLELLQKALTHKDNGETGSLITAQGEIRTANFYSWFEQNKKK